MYKLELLLWVWSINISILMSFFFFNYEFLFRMYSCNSKELSCKLKKNVCASLSSSVVLISLLPCRIMESVDPQKAAFYYLETAELHDIEEKYRDEGKAIRAAVNMYARARE